MQEDIIDFAHENNLKIDNYYTHQEAEITLQIKGMVN